MKTAIATAVALAFVSLVSFADETFSTEPMQMTAVEMDQVVAGSDRQMLRDGTGDGIADRTQLRDPTQCTN